MEVTTYFATIEGVLDLMVGNYKLVTVDMDVNPLKYHNPFGLMNCVSLTKKVLGLNKPWIITPYQLYKYLKGI